MNSPFSNINKLLVGRKKNRRIRKKREAYAEHTSTHKHQLEPELFRKQWSQAKAAHTYPHTEGSEKYPCLYSGTQRSATLTRHACLTLKLACSGLRNSKEEQAWESRVTDIRPQPPPARCLDIRQEQPSKSEAHNLVLTSHWPC